MYTHTHKDKLHLSSLHHTTVPLSVSTVSTLYTFYTASTVFTTIYCCSVNRKADYYTYIVHEIQILLPQYAAEVGKHFTMHYLCIKIRIMQEHDA